MTVPATSRRAGPFTGNGVTTSFPFTFKTFAAADLRVARADLDGVETELILNSDYTVTLNGDQDASPGGNVILPSALTTGFKLSVVGNLDLEQTTDLPTGGAFNARVVEDALDRQAIFSQQLEEKIDRTLKVSITTPTGVSTDLPTPLANHAIAWNGAADALTNLDPASLATVVADAYTVVDKWTANGSTTTYVLSNSLASSNFALVSIAGVVQNPGVDYSISGALLTFTSAPPAATVVQARYIVASGQVQNPQAAFTTESFVATAAQTTFTLQTAYIPGANSLEVFVNGLRMNPATDYAETSATVVTFVSGLTAGDEVTFVVWAVQTIGGTSAASVAFTPAGAGAVVRDAQSKLREVVSVKDFGAVGDGVTDDTAAIQAALTRAGNIFIPEGTYIVMPLQMVSDTTLTFSSEAVLQAKTGYGASDRLLNLIGISNVTIHGNFGKVRMLSAEYTTGEDRHCVNMYGVENVTVYDLVTEDSGGDGFYVGATVCRNVQIINCVADNHRRNGLSITNASNMFVLGGHYKNTGTTNTAPNGPCAGIDVESNLLENYYLENINIIGVYTSGNIGCGILVTPQSKSAPVSINLENCTSFNDGSLDLTRGKGAIAVTAAMAYTPSTPASLIGKIEGKVNVTNCSIINPIGSGFVSVNWTENAPYTSVKNLFVQNPFSGTGSPANRFKAGLFFRGETPSSGTYGTSIGNMSIEGARVEDNRAVPLMYLPIYVETADEATKPLKDLSITGIDVTAGQWTYASGLIPFAKAGTLAQTDVVLDYKNDFTAANSVTTTNINNNDVGLTRINSGNVNYVLPDAALYIGSTFKFFHSAAGNFQITPAAGDSILQYSPEAGVGIISRYVGSTMSLKAVSATEWKVVEVSGGWAAGVGYEPRFPFTYNTAAPASGTWARGDIIWNLNATAGGYVGWVCTTAGTPGTWKQFGAILP